MGEPVTHTYCMKGSAAMLSVRVFRTVNALLMACSLNPYEAICAVGVLCTSCTQKSISFPRFGNFCSSVESGGYEFRTSGLGFLNLLVKIPQREAGPFYGLLLMVSPSYQESPKGCQESNREIKITSKT